MNFALLKIFDVIPGWVYAIAIVVLLATVGVNRVSLSTARMELAQAQTELANVKAQHQTLIAEAATATAKAEKDARDKEFSLTSKLNALEKKRNEDIAATARSYERVIAGLRDRPSREAAGPNPARPGQVSPPAGSAKGATGAELYREDGGFLIGEATRADGLRVALQTCYASWDQAQVILNASPPTPQPTVH